MNENINWEERRYQIAKDVVASMLSNPNVVMIDANKDSLIRLAVNYADKLIDKLKQNKTE